MSTQLIENEIKAFLSSKQPEVICVTGKWGIGKTFAWNKYLAEAGAQKRVALPHYAYVSLFGLNSLDELKYSIFENSVGSSEIGIEPSLETLHSNTTAALKRIGKKTLGIIQQTPALKTYMGGLGPAWFLSVRSTIICIDDIERRGKGLTIRDVLGLISQLKERRGCKVALILNEEAIQEDKNEFQLYFEKVVDSALKFEPSPKESVRIALDSSSSSDNLLGENCISLGISNIRVIKKIQRLVKKCEFLLHNFDPEILKQAIHSITLMGWSLYEPAVAPDMDYIRKRGSVDSFLKKSETVSPKEALWNALLSAYGFTAMDQLDMELFAGVQAGFFDSDNLKKHAAELNKSIKSQKTEKAFFEAWEMYHDSFDNNSDAVLDAMYKSFMEAAHKISATNLSGTVTLFKELGRDKQAEEIIQRYVEAHAQDRAAFDLENDPFGTNVTNPAVVEALENKFKSFKDQRSLQEILLDIAQNHAWSTEDIQALSMASVDEYYNLFKTTTGSDLRRIVKTCLQFDTIQNASESMKEIPNRSKEALMRIGAESAINALRVKRFGITPQH